MHDALTEFANKCQVGLRRLVAMSLFTRLASVRGPATWALVTFAMFPLALTDYATLHGQEPETQASTGTYASLMSEEERAELLTSLRAETQQLRHESYRARQLARWRLEQHPELTLRIITEQIGAADHNVGAQLVDLLTVFASNKDVEISLQSMRTLTTTSEQMSSVGKLAANSLQAIADLQEEQAIEILQHNNAHIGPPDFNINAILGTGTEMSLHISESFEGDDDTIQWIQFLKSVESIYLEGPQIDSRYFEAISHLKNVQNIKLKRVQLKPEDLDYFRHFSNLQHLGLNYVDVDDAAIKHLAELPLNASLRLYGTRISQSGAKQLQSRLDGIEIYCGSGGFLGVATDRSNTVVSQVTANSGASLAGIRVGDRLTHINGGTIETFADLREQLARFLPGEQIEVRLERGGQPLTVQVTLKEDPN